MHEKYYLRFFFVFSIDFEFEYILSTFHCFYHILSSVFLNRPHFYFAYFKDNTKGKNKFELFARVIYKIWIYLHKTRYWSRMSQKSKKIWREKENNIHGRRFDGLEWTFFARKQEHTKILRSGVCYWYFSFSRMHYFVDRCILCCSFRYRFWIFFVETILCI